MITAFDGAANGERRTVDYRIRRPDGAVRWVRTSLHPIRDASGKIFRVAGIAADVTDAKSADDSRTRSLLSDRLLSLSTLAGGVAHEINNPLAVTLANLEFSLAELSN